ncbi:MAG: amidase, partial [Beijerinckiaceae bacterium]
IGTAAMDLTPKPADSPVAARMREAGSVMLGKTTMPDYGMLSSGLSSIHGVTRNPWNPACNTSGSSSGAGAAAAAGYGPLHVGTDIGGSVRLPAAHNGLFGLKPSLGRVPVNPPFMGRIAGPMTRTVMDGALLMDVISRPDARDFMSLPDAPRQYAEKLNGLRLKGLRIGLLTDMGVGLKPDRAIVAAVKDCAKALEQAGAIITPMKSYLTPAMLEGMFVFFESRSGNDIRKLSARTAGKILPYVLEWATYRSANFSGDDVMDAYNAVHAMREATVNAIGAFDFVLSPTTPVVSYPAEAASPTNDPHNALAHIAFTVAANMSEQPAAAINWSFTKDGLPLGVQLIGQRFDDLGVMRLARAVEKLRPPQRPWPVVA